MVIVPSVLVHEGGWTTGRYPRLAVWITERHAVGDTICSACSGLFLIAETGPSTVSTPPSTGPTRAYSRRSIRRSARIQSALVVAGSRGELVSSGASSSWHDLVLYLIGRDVGPVAAQTASKFFALQGHVDGLAPFIVFDPPRERGDAVVAAAQAWLDTNAAATPVRDVVRGSGITERRFQAATGHAPLDDVQRHRDHEETRARDRSPLPHLLLIAAATLMTVKG